MRRTELLQEVRKMRFEEAYGGWQERRLTQEEAARLLGVCERTLRRSVDRYEEEGLDGLVDKRLGQVSGRRAPVDEVMRTEALYRERYEGWNVKHFYSFYRREYGGERSYTWVKRTLQRAGVVVKAPGRGKHRRRRERAPLRGMMLHQSLPSRKRGSGCPRSSRHGASTRCPRRTALWPGTTGRRSTRSSRSRRPSRGRPFVPFIGPGLADVLCEHHERTVGRDNCLSFEGKRLQIPAQTRSAPLPRRAHGGVPRAAQAGRVRVRRRPGGRRRGRRAGLCRSGSLNVPPVRSPRLGMAPSSRRVGGRDIRRENSLCPDAFALPPSAAARCAPPRLRLAGACNPDGQHRA